MNVSSPLPLNAQTVIPMLIQCRGFELIERLYDYLDS